MIDTYLAIMCLESDQSLFPYLQIRAMHVLNQVDSFDIMYSTIPLPNLEMLDRSGLIRIIEKSEKQSTIVLVENSKFLGYPSTKESKVALKEDYVPADLKKLAEILGYPEDWQAKTKKYRAMYFNILKKYPQPLLECIAEWAAKNNKDSNLVSVLTANWVESLQNQMKTKKVSQGRVASSGYEDRERLEAFDRKLRGQ